MDLKYYRLKIPMKSPFTTSFGTTLDKDVIIFELNHDGIKAFSELITSEDPFYGPEDNTTAFHIIKNYLVKLIQNLPSPEKFNEISKFIRGNNMAKAAMEMLLYDYHSKVAEKPLFEFINEKPRGYANAGISLGIDKINVTLEKIQQSLDKGYKRIKVKIRKGEEVSILAPIRDHFPDIPLSADANSDYTVKDFKTLEKIDKFDLIYLEQPLYHDDIIYHSKLAKILSTPICLDESITSPEIAENAFEIGACRVVNIKPGRVGGLYNSNLIAKIASKNKGHAWIGGMLETGIGRSFNIAMASSELIDYPGDTSPNERYFSQDIVDRLFEMNDGIIKPFNSPGIGVKINESALTQFKVEEGVLS